MPTEQSVVDKRFSNVKLHWWAGVIVVHLTIIGSAWLMIELAERSWDDYEKAQAHPTRVPASGQTTVTRPVIVNYY